MSESQILEKARGNRLLAAMEADSRARIFMLRRSITSTTTTVSTISTTDRAMAWPKFTAPGRPSAR